jgi:hypothetical protein
MTSIYTSLCTGCGFEATLDANGRCIHCPAPAVERQEQANITRVIGWMLMVGSVIVAGGLWAVWR